MSMKHLVLGLALLARTLATSNPLNLKAIDEKVLDMGLTSFDDQYRGCRHMMEEELVELNHTEFTRNPIYAEGWKRAAAKWWNKGGDVPRSTALRTEHAVALMAYTLHGSLYMKFDEDVHNAGLSRREYLEKFQFKTLHFLLTEALTILRKPQTCHKVFRGVKDIRFIAWPQDLVRFSQFVSFFFRKEKAKDFGEDTFFSVNTCYGVPIKKFSAYPEKEEVLIPPYERFVVTSITKHLNSTYIQLESAGTCSNYNCEWVKGNIPLAGPSIPQDSSSIPWVGPSIPWDSLSPPLALQPVQVSLDGSAALWGVSRSSQFGVISEFAEDTLCPLIQVTDEYVEQHWTQY
ncbi:erythroblast nad (+)--arginine adp-ribosyltransferase-like [Limosa lapponica baueri]|uniref:NAD(P)(+)--arginine ADP-ribosyltransferase n=1 Tax=Limosa lapponica baueri TaxID=1758121 RepID=A0A2I0T2G7_LIMLA|nr:erythroblast nad (+)--arginine adp-ribosyltransferase-like [Limosa lapponica baueri]